MNEFTHKPLPLRQPTLTEDQELLLSAYVDNECSLVGRFKVRRLCSKNPQAKDFVEKLISTNSLTRSVLSESSADFHGALWDSIQNAVINEHNANSIQGAYRKNENTKSARFWVPADGVFSWYSDFFIRLRWGIAGATLSAFLVLMVSPATQVPFSTNRAELQPNRQIAMLEDSSRFNIEKSLSNLTSSEIASPVNYSGSNQAARESMPNRSLSPRRFSRLNAMLFSPRESFLRSPSKPGAIEVDWMRSTGRVRMLQDAQEHSAIIWINAPQRIASADQQSLNSLSSSVSSERLSNIDIPLSRDSQFE